MSDRGHTHRQTPSMPARFAAYSMVVVVPLLCFFALLHLSYGGGVVRMHGVQEVIATPTTEEIMLPDFSLLARLVHGYAASPGYGMTQRRFAEFESAAPTDVLVFGSSHAYRGFDPRVFAARGSSLFNLGSTGQTPMATRFLIEELEPRIRAKLAIVEVTPFQLLSGAGSALTVRDLALNRPPSWRSLELAAQTRDFDTTRLVASYMLAPRPALTEVPGGAPIDVATYCWYVPGGYCEWRVTGDPGLEFSTFDFQPSPDALTQLGEVATLLTAQGIQVVFVIAPMPQGTLDVAVNYDSGKAAVGALAAELGLPFLDFTDPDRMRTLNLNHPEHFYDGDHLNQNGVTAFNEGLIAELVQRELL